jgi:hypothetical protein
MTESMKQGRRSVDGVEAMERSTFGGFVSISGQSTNLRTSGFKLTTTSTKSSNTTPRKSAKSHPVLRSPHIDLCRSYTATPTHEYAPYTHFTTTPNRSHARRRRHATPATRRANPELCARSLDRVYDVEGSLSRQRLAFTNCRRTFRVHGACVPEGRSAVLVEPGVGHAGWRDRGVQC